MSPRPRKASDAEVFAAAVRVMGRVGPAQLTLAAIADEAGLTAGALVQRFGSKLALLRALSKGAADGSGTFAAELRATHRSPLAGLVAYARCVAGLAPSPAALARNLAYLQLDLTDRHLYPSLLRQAQATRAAYRTFLGDAAAAGEIDGAADVDWLARIVDTTVTGSLMTWAVYRDGDAAAWIERDVRAALAPYLTAASRPHPARAGHGARPPELNQSAPRFVQALMLSNLRLAVRTLVKTPFVTAIAVLSLALGIGANTAIFSLFDRMLLRPLPVPEPTALVNLGSPRPKPGSNSCNQAGDCDWVFSHPMFRDLERVQTVFTGVAGHCLMGVNLAARGQTTSGDGVAVSGSYFPTLGLQPALGRLLTPDDDRTPGAHPVVVLSHAYWTSHFGENPDVLGSQITVNGASLTVIGIAPRGFEGTTLGTRPHVFVPMTMREVLLPDWKGLDDRRNYWVYAFARLKPGVTIEQARAAMEVPYRAIIIDVEVPLQTALSDQTMERFRTKPLLVEPGARGQSDVRVEARAPLLLLLGVTTLVLITACANIANLLLARAAGRSVEMAVRLSIGASRWQVLRQLLVESCTLALLGGLAGLLVSRWTLAGIAALLPPEAATTVPSSIDATVLLYALALSLGTGLVFGLYPALHSTRPDLIGVLKGHSGQPSGARAASRFRTGLATSQIALSMALLAAAGLFTKSLYNVSRVDLGLATDRLVTFSVSPSLNGYPKAQTLGFYERVEAALAALPGARSVSASTVSLIAGNNWNNSMRVQGFEAGPDTNTSASFSMVGPDFFRTLGIPLLQGREFTVADGGAAPRVAVVNQAFARKFNLGDHVIGTRVGTGRDSTGLDIEIVGLVQDAKYSEVKAAIPAQIFRPYRQGGDENVGSMSFYVHTDGDAAAMLGPAQAAVRALDQNLPIESPKTMAQQVRENVFLDRMISTLSAGFAMLATVLAAIGLYGVLAYTVTQRTREFGLRMALGADAASVRRMVLGHVARMTAVGALVGLVAAVGIGQLARALLFELEGYDPIVLAVSTIVLAMVAAVAGLLPALRASRIQPMVALRQD